MPLRQLEQLFSISLPVSLTQLESVLFWAEREIDILRREWKGGETVTRIMRITLERNRSIS